ncbi:MAG: hypothetical protein JSS09_06640, partial [Verrucomicrobia bacterium]|nr:hypothetical protein [Verrucomicrobiota bacterium]
FPYPEILLKKIYSQSIFFEEPFPHRYHRQNVGGVPAYFLYKDIPTFNLEKMLSNAGIVITFSITLVTSFLLFTQIQLLPLIRKILQMYSDFKKKKELLLCEMEMLEETPSISVKKPLKALEESLSTPPIKPLYRPAPKEIRIRTEEEKFQ